MAYQLTYFDTVSVQDYIYNSNKLKHIIGASALVHKAANDWIFEILQKLGKTDVDITGKIYDDVRIDQPDVFSELVYAGGGNAVILFKPDKHLEFARLLSVKIHTEAPGLDFVICHDSIRWEKPDADELRLKLKALIWKASLKKQNRPHSAPLPGLGVTAICPYTGKPASGRNEDGVRVSSEILAKERAVLYANQRLSAAFDDDDHKREYLFDLDEIEGDQKGSYIGIVHVDGTDMGKRIGAISGRPENKDNREFISQMRMFSNSIKTASQNAMKATIDYIEDLSSTNPEVIRLVKGKLPFRPIVFGGDDITFVCDGMNALPLAVYHLQRLSDPSNKLIDEHPIFARSGVAVVKSHFPFAQAYAMADALNKSARAYAKLIDPVFPPPTIDWYFSSSGPVLNLKRIRDKKYSISENNRTLSLMMRPLVVGENNLDSWRTWESFLNIINELLKNLSETQRNNLFQVLAQGPDKVAELVEARNLSLPKILPYIGVEKNGWIDDFSFCHDPLEAMDFMNWK